MIAAQAILDRGYGKPVQSIDANINEDNAFRYYAEVAKPCSTTAEWLAGNPPLKKPEASDHKPIH
jgi:hypothetical protein